MEFSAIQEMISKIDGVINVKVIANETDIEEIHILANNLRAPKQIVRDIESSILASFNFRIDRKTISIAQIETDEHEEIKRIKFGGISVNTSENTIHCTVNLYYNDEEHSVTQMGIKTSSKRRKIVAETTIKVVEQILGQDAIFDIVDVIESNTKEVSFVSVLVSMLVGNNEEVMVGSAVIKNDINEAISKATLDAINRRVQKNNL